MNERGKARRDAIKVASISQTHKAMYYVFFLLMALGCGWGADSSCLIWQITSSLQPLQRRADKFYISTRPLDESTILPVRIIHFVIRGLQARPASLSSELHALSISF